MHEAYQTNQGNKVEDSGGDRISLGPVLNIDLGKHSTVFSSFLSPVYQDVGGIHQKQDFTWTVGAKIGW